MTDHIAELHEQRAALTPAEWIGWKMFWYDLWTRMKKADAINVGCHQADFCIQIEAIESNG